MEQDYQEMGEICEVQESSRKGLGRIQHLTHLLRFQIVVTFTRPPSSVQQVQ